MDYGLRLKSLILESGRKQKDVADELGVHRQTMSRWVNSRYPELESIERVCGSLGISLKVFFGGDDIGDRLLRILKEAVNAKC